MKFAHPEMFILLWALPLLLLAYGYGWRRRRRILERYGDPGVLAPLLPARVAVRRCLRAGMTLLAALLLVLGMAGPQNGVQWQTAERRGADLVIVLDCSRSMLADDTPPTRLERAKREIIDLLGMLQGDRVGLVAFSGTAFLQCPLTVDYAALDLFLRVLTPDYLPVGGSDLSTAIQTALDAFDPRDPAEKAVILITDGEHTAQNDPQTAALAARQAGVRLFCIGVGTANGVPVPSARGGLQKDRLGQIVLTRLDEALLSRLALATGGRYVRAVAGDADLERIYREQIRATMNLATLAGERHQVWADRFQWPLALALVLLLIAWALPEVKQCTKALCIILVLLGPAAQSAAGPLQEGYSAYEQAQYDRALDRFHQGQARRPDDPRVLYNIGNACYKNGDFDAAQTHYQRALFKAPPELKAWLHYNLGNTAYRRHALAEAIGHYQRALEIDPGDQQARDNLAFVRRQLAKRSQPSDPPQEKVWTEPPSPDNQGSPPTSGLQTSPPPPDPDRKAPIQPGGAGIDTPDHDDESTRRDDQMVTGDQTPSPHVDRLLNRLKDEPGRALMPRYQPQTVEKDW